VVPGKKYTPEDFLDIARRRIWLIIVPFVLVATATAIESKLTPNLYRSETVILVVPQRIPESYVRSTVTSRIEDRLQSIGQQILSRTRLERIILDFNLYASARRSQPMENVVEIMRRDIEIETVKGDAFKVSYVSGDPRAAMEVTNRLSSLFIEENRRDREVLADGTNQFLESQLEDARRRLAEHEKRVEQYRQQYSGELPTQVQSNLQAIQNTQLQLQAVSESLDRDRDRRIAFERSIADATASDERPTAAPAASAEAAAPTEEDELEAARRTLRDLQGRLTAEHPDVIRASRRVRELEAKAAAPAAPRPAAAAPTDARPTRSAATAARVRSLQNEIQNVDRQITYKEGEERRLRTVIATYQARVDAAPKRESELIELTRDYTTLQQLYTSLLAKREDSKIAANLERRQAGEQFRVLDPARIPERPFSPNRTRMNLMGAVAGLALGLGLVALLEYRDTTLRSDDDVVSTLHLPVLAVIPLLVTSIDERVQKRRRWLAVAAAAAVMVIGTAVVVWKVTAH
jgi:polysaccharide chain length determinant protein (PEP-CTERM system associated)